MKYESFPLSSLLVAFFFAELIRLKRYRSDSWYRLLIVLIVCFAGEVLSIVQYRVAFYYGKVGFFDRFLR